MRLPAYGVVEEARTETTRDVITVSTDDKGKEVETTTTEDVTIDENRGFLAIITEDDALANITTSHGGALHKYATVYTQFYPRPKDSYNLAEAISVGSNATWTVVSKRKYTGSYRIQYIMLTDSRIAKSKGISDYYETSWMGMANAFKDYYKKNDLLSTLDTSTVSSDLPLYVETLGVIDTQQVVLSIPVMVKTPLTSFDDIETMANEFSAAGVSNLVFRLTGYYNGGYYNKIPTTLKFERKAGGNKGYNELIDYATTKGIEIYPDFDFVYAYNWGVTSGFSLVRRLKTSITATPQNVFTRGRADLPPQRLRSDFPVGLRQALSEVRKSVLQVYHDGHFRKHSRLGPQLGLR